MKNKAFKITQTFADNATSNGAKLARFWDSGQPGLLLRVTANGAKTWYVSGRQKDGGKIEAKIGRFPAMKVDAARLEAARVIVSGANPVQEKKAAKRDAGRLKDETFEALAMKFMEAKNAKVAAGDLRQTTVNNYRGLLDKYVLPELGGRSFSEIKRLDVKTTQQVIFEGVKRANATGGTTARHALTLISMIYNWALDEELVQFNPAERVKPLARPKSRERVLSETELRAVWGCLSTKEGREAAEVSEAVSIALRLCLLTLLRRASVVGLHPAEVDLGAATWQLPAARMKSKRAFMVPLSDPAKMLVRHAKADPKVIATTYEHDFNKARARAERDYHERHGAGGWRILDAGNERPLEVGPSRA